MARTTLYHLLANPTTLQKLHAELQTANLTRPFPKYSEVRDLPYLDACVQEGSRMHPPFALPFERVVPEGGVEVLGQYLPAGTNIGGNPYVVNRDKATFGEDAEGWRPERWIEQGDEHKKTLERSNLTVSTTSEVTAAIGAALPGWRLTIWIRQFGAGRRVCLGKHIGILEIKKFISFLVLTYEVRTLSSSPWPSEMGKCSPVWLCSWKLSIPSSSRSTTRGSSSRAACLRG